MIGGTTQHQRSSTQVSLVPPPWEEFTTKEPSRKATRVSPPGTSVTSRPDNTNGRRSICRGATPPSTYVGPADNPNVGCAIYFSGERNIRSQNASSSALLAVGPINIP